MSTVFDWANRKEDLHPDLAEYLLKTDTFTWIKHPLLITIHHEAMNAMYNDQYAAKKGYLATLEANKDWERAMWFHERAYRFMMFRNKYSQLMGDERAAKELPDLWRDTEFPYAAYDEWLDAWRVLAPLNPVLEKSKEHLPSTPFTVYRGMSTAEFVGDHPLGISWTIDHQKAVWFARRFQPDGGKVVSAIVHPNVVFAYLPERGESEVVVDADEIQEFDEDLAGEE